MDIIAIAAVLIPSSAAVMLAGIVPRAGPVRAVALAARSWMRSTDVVSLRTDASESLRGMLRNLGKYQYIVVTGQKGVGKSVIVNTVTQRTCGVVSVSVSPGKSQNDIVVKVLSEVANSRVGSFDPRPSVRRVLWWYSWFLPRPIVVLRAGERTAGDNYAATLGAARELSTLGLRVLVDGSTNSMSMDALATQRQDVLEVEPVPRDTLFSIPEYESLINVLRKEGLEDVAWGVLGGVPAHFDAMLMLLKRYEPGAFCRVTVNYLLDEVGKAIGRRDRMLAAHPAMKGILKVFLTNDEVPESLLAEQGVVGPSPNTLLRVVLHNHVAALVPADASAALVLRHGFKTTPTIDELITLLAFSSPADTVIGARRSTLQPAP